MAALEIRDAFLAITSWEKPNLRTVGGFRFKGTADDVEKLIARWRGQLGQGAELQRETSEYQGHRIEVIASGGVRLATTYSGEWFFAANDLAPLQALLDRADRRVKDSASTLAADDEFIATAKHTPSNYVCRVYGRLDRYFAKLEPATPPSASANEQLSLLRRLRTFSATTSFEDGKIRDVVFIGMPKVGDLPDLNRASLSLATRNTFLYLASFLRLPQQLPTPDAAAGGFPPAAQGLLRSLAEAGVTREALDAAFGTEFGVIGNWAADSRLPFLFATLPVKDEAKARDLLGKWTSLQNEGAPWAKSEQDGVQYYSLPAPNPMLPIAPTIALSRERLIFGHDAAAVEAVMKRGGSASELASVDDFRSAERQVPAATVAFTYLDTAMFYTRLDAAVRPMLVMAAAFLPSIAQTVDLGKLPPPEVITRHLSPIVMSQRYVENGYLSESAGPVSLYQATLGVAGLTGVGTALYRGGLSGFSTPFSTTPLPSPSPEESTDE